MNIKELTIEQLKAIKCDHYENIKRSESTIHAINSELLRRQEDEALKIAETNGVVAE